MIVPSSFKNKHSSVLSLYSSILYYFQLLPHNVTYCFHLCSSLTFLMAKSHGTGNKKTCTFESIFFLVFFVCLFPLFSLVITSHNCRIRIKNCRWYRQDFLTLEK